MRRIIITLALASMPVATLAMDLNEARAAGKVCELPTGYVKAVSPDAASLAIEVNAKRKQAYAAIAAENKQSVDVAGKLAHGQIVANGAAACK